MASRCRLTRGRFDLSLVYRLPIGAQQSRRRGCVPHMPIFQRAVGVINGRTWAAAIMSLVHSARINGHEPHAYLKDVMERLPTQPASRIGELLPHRWRPTANT